MNKAAGARGKIFSTHAVPHVYADAFGKPIDAERFWQALLQQKNGWGNEGNYSILSNWQFRPALLSIFNFSLLSTYRSDSGFIRLGVPSYPKSSDLVIWRFFFFFHHCSVLGFMHFSFHSKDKTWALFQYSPLLTSFLDFSFNAQ